MALGGPRQPAHSALMPASFTTVVHFFDSAATKAAKSCGEPIFGRALSLERIVSMSLVLRISLIAALSLSTTALGVPAGARTPDQNVACRLGSPASVVVGTSGSCGLRVSSALARALSFPASLCGSRIGR